MRGAITMLEMAIGGALLIGLGAYVVDGIGAMLTSLA